MMTQRGARSASRRTEPGEEGRCPGPGRLAGQSQFRVDVREVALDGPLAEVHGCRDLGVAPAVGHEPEDLELPRRQLRGRGSIAFRWRGTERLDLVEERR